MLLAKESGPNQILFILFLFLPLFSKKFRNFIKEKNYNPLYCAYGQKSTVKELFESYGKELSFVFSDVFSSMKIALSECKFYFNHDLIDNIVIRGIPAVTLKILKKEKEKNER